MSLKRQGYPLSSDTVVMLLNLLHDNGVNTFIDNYLLDAIVKDITRIFQLNHVSGI